MVDMELLRKRGVTQEHLKSKLTGDPLTMPGKPGELVNRIRSRCQEGRSRNFLEYQTYWVIDQAWDTPFRQLNPTLLTLMKDADTASEEILNKVKSMGLADLITEEIDPKSGKPTGKKVFNLPMFFSIIVPLVRSYVTVRWAKIMNDRRLIPFFKYEPIKVTTALRAKCEVLTDRVQVMTNQYGYFDVTKQAVLKMLMYSFCFQFPKEDWHSEAQWRFATDEDVQLGKKKENGELVKVGDEIKVTDREGIRYEHPHPTRTFWDLAHGKHTFNYDSGCEYAGYWRVTRYKEILDSPDVWNKEMVHLGSTDIISANRAFFQSVYGACTLTCPVFSPQVKTTDGNIGGALGSSDLDREKALANQYYGTDQKDQGVLVTEYFEKLIPKDYDLGDYDCPVWFRFLVAGDGATILYATPLPYPPVVYYGYDADENRAKNPSMAMEILPFQDLFSNTLSQINLTARQNLANAVFVDKDQMTDDGIKRIENAGEKLFRALNIFSFSSKQALKAQNKIVEVTHSASFPKGNIGELTNVLKTILDILDRVMVMSQQEVAQAASHEQTREEIRNIASTTSSRLQFTATPVDIARDAWKRQLYLGLMAYGDDDIYAQLPAEIQLNKDVLTKLGFTYVDRDDQRGANDRYRTVKTTKKAIAMPLWSFSSTRDGEDRSSDQQTAQAMAMLWDKVANHPITGPALGADQLLEWANQIGQLAGINRDFKLRNAAGSPEEQQAAKEKQMAEAQKMISELVDQKIAQAGAPLVEEMKHLEEQVGQNSQSIEQLVQLAKEAMPMAGA